MQPNSDQLLRQHSKISHISKIVKIAQNQPENFILNWHASYHKTTSAKAHWTTQQSLTCISMDKLYKLHTYLPSKHAPKSPMDTQQKDV